MDRHELNLDLERRSAKICSTLYSITEILNPDEPLRMHVRTEIVRLLSNSVSFGRENVVKVMSHKAIIEDSIGQLIAATFLLRDTRLINQTTCQSLESELRDLKVALSNAGSSANYVAESVQGLGKFQVSSSSEVFSPARPSLSPAVQGNKDRRNKILELLRVKGPSSVSDLAEHVEGCSDKTIQRELVSMLSLGLLRKTGERRWSRYSVA